MNRFPKEFEEILTPAGLKILKGSVFVENNQFKINPRKDLPLYPEYAPLIFLPGMIKPKAAQGMYDLINENFYRLFKLNEKPISSSNAYPDRFATDSSIHFKTIYFLNRRRDKVLRLAEELGLFDMQTSQSWVTFMQNITGLALTAMRETCQLNLYEHGDHVGLHTDYWENKEGEAVRFIGVHMGMTNPHVESMGLNYQQGKFMTGYQNTVAMGSLAVFMFPFWHATTPLKAKPGKVLTARRYLHLSTLKIAGQPDFSVEDLKYL